MAKKDRNLLKKLISIILGGFLFELFFLLFKKGRKKTAVNRSKLNNFKKQETKEIKKFGNGKEPFNEFFSHSLRLLKDIFIPHEHNNHKPKILRHKTLLSAALILLSLKLLLAGYLFFSFPQGAGLSEVVTSKILLLINQDRSKDNLKKLTVNPILSASALKKAEDMMANDYFAHHSPAGLKPWDFIDRSQYPYSLVGENLAINFTTADSVHKALMDSESHRKNILNPNYSEIGLAMVNGTLNGQNTNLLVEMFAARPEAKLALAEKTEEIIPKEEETASIPDIAPENISTLGESAKDGIVSGQTVPEEVLPEAVKDVEAGALEGGENIDKAPEEAGEEEILTPDIEAGGEAGELEIQTEGLPSEETGLDTDFDSQTNTQVMRTKNIDRDGIIFTVGMIKAVDAILISVLSVFSIALLFNIFIRIKVQHKHVIIQSIIFLIFVSGLVYFKFHYLENILSDILIM